MPHDPLFMATAIDVVLRAGELQRERVGQGIRIDKKGTIDLVTEVDLAVERMCRRMLAERFPDHDILAEELPTRSASGGPSRYCWVFDPIDGTINYAHGLPIFCASLALEIDGRVEIGAVYDPSREELFTAERGDGARLNGRPLHVSATAEIVDAMLCTGFPYDVHLTVDEVVGLFGRFVGQSQAVRRLGSAALDLCYVAAGRFDGFWEQRLQPWDVAAAGLIVEESGGCLTDFAGQPFDTRAGRVVASNGRLHDAMVATISAFEADRSRNRTS
jgi:myo-inositol-1(or 4)-monophosphatase